jgi:hypothetical protein
MKRSEFDSGGAERRELVRSALAGVALGLMLWSGTAAIRAAWGDDGSYYLDVGGDPEPPECYDGDGNPKDPLPPDPD